MVRVGFAGGFAASLEGAVRARLELPVDVIVADEIAIVQSLAEVDVLVTLAFTRAMGAGAGRLKLVQVPGAGLDRIDRSALPPGTFLANVHGHETGIAEYTIGAMLALAREFVRLAWHLGNRHTDVQIVGERIRIRRDHVLEDMLRGLGAQVTPLNAAFDPETGAPHIHAHDAHEHTHHHDHHSHSHHHHGHKHER